MIVTARGYRQISWKMRGTLAVFALTVAPLSLFGSQSGVADGDAAKPSNEAISRPTNKPAATNNGNHDSSAAPTTPNSDASIEAAEVFQTAMERIQANYENLRTVKVTFETLSVDPSVERREKLSGKLEGGGRWTTTVAPVFIQRKVVTLEGQNLRAESYDRIGSDWNHVSTYVRRGNTWTIFHRTSNWIQTKTTMELGSFFPLDPRDFGGLDQRHGLLEQMRRSEARSVSQNKAIVDVVAEIVKRPKYGYPPGQQFTYSLDTRKNYLPTRVVRHYHDGTINVLTELSYEEIEAGKSWFVRELTQKYFAEDVSAKTPDSSGWHQLLTYKAVTPIHVNEPINDDFKIRFPADARVE